MPAESARKPDGTSSPIRRARRPAEPPRAWQRMLSGRRLDLLNPWPPDIEIEDIAHGLSRVSRWNGQTTGEWPYSVADHSLLVEEIFSRRSPRASNDARLIALLHDAPEYVIGDLISPFKAMVGGGYRDLEDRLFRATMIRFGLPPEPPAATMKAIKRADIVAAHAEAVSLAGFSQEEAGKIFKRPREPELAALRVSARTPSQAKADFLARFQELAGASEAKHSRC